MLPFGLKVKKKREKGKRNIMVFVTCPKLREKVKMGIRRVGGRLLGLMWVTSLGVRSSALLEPSLATGNFASVWEM